MTKYEIIFLFFQNEINFKMLYSFIIMVNLKKNLELKKI
jgi:hypothetical protein